MRSPVQPTEDRFWSLPNGVTLARLACFPVLLVLAYRGHERAFVVLLGLALVSDIVDGALARRLGLASAWGARLDSWADLGLYATVPLGVGWLRPGLLREEAWTFWTIVLAYLVPVAYGFLRYRSLTSYHTRGAVIAAYLVGGATLVLFAGGPVWPLRLAAVFLVLAELEEIAITSLLPEPVAMVRSVRQALAIRRERFPDRPPRGR